MEKKGKNRNQTDESEVSNSGKQRYLRFAYRTSSGAVARCCWRQAQH